MSGRRECGVAFALLVAPAVGFGQWEATIDLNVGGAHTIDVDPGESFTLSLGLNSNEPVSGIQFAFSINGGADNHLFQGAFDAADLNSYGNLFGPPFPVNPNLFGLGDLASQMTTTPVPLAGLAPELIFRNTGETGQTNMGVFPGSLLHYTLTMPQEPGYYEISLSDAILTNSGGSIVPHVIPIPEPSSGLLLLGAVPFLFRRRR